MSGRYWVQRTYQVFEMVQVIADSPDEAMELGKTIPVEVFRETQVPSTRPKYSLGGVSLSDTRPAWNESLEP